MDGVGKGTEKHNDVCVSGRPGRVKKVKINHAQRWIITRAVSHVVKQDDESRGKRP